MRAPLALLLCALASPALALPSVPHLPGVTAKKTECGKRWDKHPHDIRAVTIDEPIPKPCRSGPWLWNPPFDGDFRAIVLSRKDWAVMGAHRRCDRNGRSPAGCTTIIDGRCWPFVNAALAGADIEKAKRHEIAHCRGWRH